MGRAVNTGKLKKAAVKAKAQLAKINGKKTKEPEKAPEVPAVDIGTLDVAALVEKALEAATNFTHNLIGVGKAVEPIQRHGLWAMKEAGSHVNFESFCEIGLGLPYSTVAKALLLVRGYAALGIDPERAIEVGVGKAYAILRVAEDQDAAVAWLKKAEVLTGEKLDEALDKAKPRTVTKGGSKVKRQTFKFVAEDAQIANIQEAISSAMEAMGTKVPGEAFDSIATFYNVNHLQKSESLQHCIGILQRTYSVKLQVVEASAEKTPAKKAKAKQEVAA